MAAAQISFILPLITLQLLMISGTPKGVISSTIFSMENKCNYTIWPVVRSNAGVPVTGNFALHNGESKNISAPPSWSGRLWGRTLCSKHNSTATDKLSCLTGGINDDGTKSPATLAEFNIKTGIGLYAFYVSLVEGYNIPIEIVPVGGIGENCKTTACVIQHLNKVCPSELKLTNGTVGCKSACQAYNQNPKYCIKASPYSDIFKKACPRAYTYVYDNTTTIYSYCSNAQVYVITFCPLSPTTSQKSFEGQDTMNDQNGGGGGANFPTPLQILGITMAIPGFVVAILQIWRHL